jgi:tRNA A-37 threonylcarbamoyl transferase component Bud32
MATLDINPRYETCLRQQGLACPLRLLELPGLIVSGHPDRHVARVALAGVSRGAAYLKREHRVRWRDRLASAWAGFGPVSRSLREARTLAALRQSGVPCPDWIAAGETDDGRAFLLLEDFSRGVDLRQFLAALQGKGIRTRVRFAMRLGRALARLHASGFDHPDLYAKHVLVDPDTQEIVFIDFQRSRRRARLSALARQRDLAALDATVAEHLAAPIERIACLRAYLKASALTAQASGALGAEALRACTKRLLRRGHVRKERASPPPLAARGVIWLDGEALCVTEEFWNEVGGEVPEWLRMTAGAWASAETQRTVVPLPGGGRGLLVQRQCSRPLGWLWSVLRCRPLRSPELREAGVLFRQRKHGQAAPRVLAFGQRLSAPWRTESFLLTEMTAPEHGRGT